LPTVVHALRHAEPALADMRAYWSITLDTVSGVYFGETGRPFRLMPNTISVEAER